jgi:hypothetical protein
MNNTLTEYVNTINLWGLDDHAKNSFDQFFSELTRTQQEEMLGILINVMGIDAPHPAPSWTDAELTTAADRWIAS